MGFHFHGGVSRQFIIRNSRNSIPRTFAARPRAGSVTSRSHGDQKNACSKKKENEELLVHWRYVVLVLKYFVVTIG